MFWWETGKRGLKGGDTGSEWAYVRAGSVSALMAEFRSVQLGEVDSKGRNRRDDRHYFGLVRSVVISVQRMVAACRDEDEKEDAVGLLMAMSLLHGSELSLIHI